MTERSNGRTWAIQNQFDLVDDWGDNITDINWEQIVLQCAPIQLDTDWTNDRPLAIG